MKLLLVFLVVVTTAVADEVKLPSGRVVNVLKTGPMVFTSKLPTAWVLLYETKHPWSEKKEIIAEVEDIWSNFRLEVEKRQMKMGIIKVTGPATGVIVQERTEINFVFEPKKEGGWMMQLPDLMKEEKKKAEPDGAANGSQPARSETNRTSSAAGSRP
jgi:hypothetical protein